MSNRKIIVLDDDPTGVQTVHGVNVYTDWDQTSLDAGFAEPNEMFFILTNSRAFSRSKTIEVHRTIAERINRAARSSGRDFVVISRSDSTLRGHFPIETEILASTLEKKFDGEILIPFFKEGGRTTVHGVHYVDGVPAAQTEFARDKTFPFAHSDLAEYIEEKTEGRFNASSVIRIDLDELRAASLDPIVKKLDGVSGFNKVIVDAIEYSDLERFVDALARSKKNFMFRTAAAFPKVLGGISDRPLLDRSELIDEDNPNGGLIVVGSHVRKTTDQLNALRSLGGIKFLEFDVRAEEFDAEIDEKLSAIEKSLARGETAVLFTTRRRIDLPSKEASLSFSVKVSAALSTLVKRLETRPRFLISKGGITSSDVGTLGLGVKRALVLGQVEPGIPVWKLGAESKFPGMSYVIFPGNVGGVETLRAIVEKII